MGKWAMFKVERDEAVRRYVKEKRKILGLNKIMRHIRFVQMITVIHTRFNNKLAYQRRMKIMLWSSALIAKQFSNRLRRTYGADSIEKRNLKRVRSCLTFAGNMTNERHLGLKITPMNTFIKEFLQGCHWRNEVAEIINSFGKTIRYIQGKWRAQSLFAQTRHDKLMQYWKEEYDRFYFDLHDSKDKEDKKLLKKMQE